MLELRKVRSGGNFYFDEEVVLTISKFPAGETLLKVAEHHFDNKPNLLKIILRFRSNEDLINLGLLVDALRRMNPDFPPQIDLVMSYVPYARQDRVCNSGESHSLFFIASYINSLNFKTVEVFDPHSDVVEALFNNVKIIPSLDTVVSIFYKYGLFIPVSPDAGANKKVSKIAQALGIDFIRADKVRETKTGKLSGAKVFSEHVGNQNLMIVDDICDGGGTFSLLAPELRKITTGKVSLYVSHGIFSKGLDHLAVDFDAIYVKNNLSGLKHPKLKEVS